MINVYLLTQEYLKIFQNQNQDIITFSIFFSFLPKNETKNSKSIEKYFSSKKKKRKKKRDGDTIQTGQTGQTRTYGYKDQ